MILPTVLRRNIVLMFAIQHAKPANILKFEININYYTDTQYQNKEILNIDIPSKKAINMSIFSKRKIIDIFAYLQTITK